jgi:hypothetical protein
MDSVVQVNSLYPICVLSHNRPNSKTIRELIKIGINPIIFLDTEEMMETYEKNGLTSDKVTYVTAGKRLSVPEKRNFILGIMKNVFNKDKIFVFDDDINAINENVYNEEKKKSVPIGKGITLEALIKWKKLHDSYSDCVISSPIHAGCAWCANENKSSISNTSTIQAILLDLNFLVKNNIEYRDNCWEDFDLILQIASKGGKPYVFKGLSYSPDPSTPNKSEIAKNFDSFEDKQNKLSYGLLNLWDDKLVKIRQIRGYTNARISWSEVKRRFYGK